MCSLAQRDRFACDNLLRYVQYYLRSTHWIGIFKEARIILNLQPQPNYLWEENGKYSVYKELGQELVKMVLPEDGLDGVYKTFQENMDIVPTNVILLRPCRRQIWNFSESCQRKDWRWISMMVTL
jgi:hypothetical protein